MTLTNAKTKYFISAAIFMAAFSFLGWWINTTTEGRRFLTAHDFGTVSIRAERALADEVVKEKRYPTQIGREAMWTKIPLTWNPEKPPSGPISIPDVWTPGVFSIALDADAAVDLFAVRKYYPQLFRTSAETATIERGMLDDVLADGRDDWLFGKMPKAWHLFKPVAQKVLNLPEDEAMDWLSEYARDTTWFLQAGYPAPKDGIGPDPYWSKRRKWLESTLDEMRVAWTYNQDLFLDGQRAGYASIPENRIIYIYGVHTARDYVSVYRSFSPDQPFALESFNLVRGWTRARVAEFQDKRVADENAKIVPLSIRIGHALGNIVTGAMSQVRDSQSSK